MVVYSILQQFFNLKITSGILLAVNKITSVFILVLVYLISKTVFKSKFMGILVLFSFIPYIFVQRILNSIEHGTFAMLFSLTSIYFLIKFSGEKKIILFNISILSLVLASYYRFELSLLLGLPYIIWCSFFLNNKKKIRKQIFFTIFLLLILLMPLVVTTLVVKDEIVIGKNLEGDGILSIIQNSKNILLNNIIEEKDLSLKSGTLSLFSYSTLLIYLVLVFFLSKNIICKKETYLRYRIYYFFAFYNLIFFIFLMSFFAQGLRNSANLQAFYYISEIILTYFALFWILDKYFKKEKFHNVLKVALPVFFLLLSFFVSPAMSFDNSLLSNHFYIEQEMFEINLIQENINFDGTCKLLKIHPGQPNFDYYLGLQKNSVYLGIPPEFYESIWRYDKIGKCFYYYDEKYLTPRHYDYEGMFKVNSERIDDLFGLCNKRIEFESPLKDRPFSLIKYVC